MANIIDVVIILLPRRHFLEKRLNWLDRVEKRINEDRESLPHDYKVPAEVSNVTLGFNEFGLPKTAIFIIEEKKAKT